LKRYKNLLILLFLLISIFSFASKKVYIQWKEMESNNYFNEDEKTFISMKSVSKRFNKTIDFHNDSLVLISHDKWKVFLFPSNALAVINSVESFKFEKEDIKIIDNDIYLTPEIMSKIMNLKLLTNSTGYYLNLPVATIQSINTIIQKNAIRTIIELSDDVETEIFELVSSYGYLLKIKGAELPNVLYHQDYTDPKISSIRAYHYTESEIWIRIVLNRKSELSTIYETRRIILDMTFPDIERPILVIDPGHGGSDPGAVGFDNTYEKDIVLEVSLMTAELLEKYEIDVFLTRETDVYIDLYQRTAFSNSKGADLFVSIHLNSFPEIPEVQGSEIYYFDFSESKYARQIAWKENLDFNIDRNLIETWVKDKSNSINESERFSNMILNNIKDNGIKPRGVYPGEFAVLAYTRAPAVLWEMEFLSNKEIEKKFLEENYAEEFAEILKKAIVEYFDLE